MTILDTLSNLLGSNPEGVTKLPTFPFMTVSPSLEVLIFQNYIRDEEEESLQISQLLPSVTLPFVPNNRVFANAMCDSCNYYQPSGRETRRSYTEDAVLLGFAPHYTNPSHVWRLNLTAKSTAEERTQWLSEARAKAIGDETLQGHHPFFAFFLLVAKLAQGLTRDNQPVTETWALSRIKRFSPPWRAIADLTHHLQSLGTTSSKAITRSQYLTYLRGAILNAANGIRDRIQLPSGCLDDDLLLNAIETLPIPSDAVIEAYHQTFANTRPRSLVGNFENKLSWEYYKINPYNLSPEDWYDAKFYLYTKNIPVRTMYNGRRSPLLSYASTNDWAVTADQHCPPTLATIPATLGEDAATALFPVVFLICNYIGWQEFQQDFDNANRGLWVHPIFPLIITLTLTEPNNYISGREAVDFKKIYEICLATMAGANWRTLYSFHEAEQGSPAFSPDHGLTLEQILAFYPESGHPLADLNTCYNFWRNYCFCDSTPKIFSRKSLHHALAEYRDDDNITSTPAASEVRDFIQDNLNQPWRPELGKFSSDQNEQTLFECVLDAANQVFTGHFVEGAMMNAIFHAIAAESRGATWQWIEQNLRPEDYEDPDSLESEDEDEDEDEDEEGERAVEREGERSRIFHENPFNFRAAYNPDSPTYEERNDQVGLLQIRLGAIYRVINDAIPELQTNNLAVMDRLHQMTLAFNNEIESNSNSYQKFVQASNPDITSLAIAQRVVSSTHLNLATSMMARSHTNGAPYQFFYSLWAANVKVSTLRDTPTYDFHYIFSSENIVALPDNTYLVAGQPVLEHPLFPRLPVSRQTAGRDNYTQLITRLNSGHHAGMEAHVVCAGAASLRRMAAEQTPWPKMKNPPSVVDGILSCPAGHTAVAEQTTVHIRSLLYTIKMSSNSMHIRTGEKLNQNPGTRSAYTSVSIVTDDDKPRIHYLNNGPNSFSRSFRHQPSICWGQNKPDESSLDLFMEAYNAAPCNEDLSTHEVITITNGILASVDKQKMAETHATDHADLLARIPPCDAIVVFSPTNASDNLFASILGCQPLSGLNNRKFYVLPLARHSFMANKTMIPGFKTIHKNKSNWFLYPYNNSRLILADQLP